MQTSICRSGNFKRLRRKREHVTIAPTEPQHRRLCETNDQQDSPAFAEFVLQFWIVTASIGIIFWLVSALRNGEFDEHSNKFLVLIAFQQLTWSYREIAVDRCPQVESPQIGEFPENLAVAC